MAVIVSDPLQPCFRADIEHKRQAFFLAVDALDVLLSPPGYPFCVCLPFGVRHRPSYHGAAPRFHYVMAGHQEKAGLPFLRLPCRSASVIARLVMARLFDFITRVIVTRVMAGVEVVTTL